jgi:DNA polymerase
MPELFWDTELRSAASLRLVGPWNYAAHPTTEMLCLCYAVDGGEVQTWINKSLLDPSNPGDPVPEPFLAAARDPKNWRLISQYYEFERAVLKHQLIPKHGFPPIPLEAQHCSMAVALANGYPAELETLAKALELPYQKDREGLLLMRQMSRPRKPRKGEDKSVLHWIFDAEKLQRLAGYCAQDTRTARAAWQHPKIKPLIESERRYQILDAVINQRGVRADRELATAARDMAVHERNAINAASALQEHTGGEITSVDQVGKILTYATKRGHAMTSVGRCSVSAVLAAEPDEATRTVLELRRDGARASVRKYERILAYASDADDRMRGTLRMYGAGPGRWSGRGPQLQNLKKNEGNIPLAAVDAVRTKDRAQLRQYGNPLTVLSDIARATVCAAADHVLMAADFGAIESRILAWFSGETWKLETYREFDRTNDKAKEPYRVVAAKMLQKNDPAGLSREERNKGKAGDLACGFGGSVGAWRRIASDDKRSDPEILDDVRAWRDTHPKTIAYWRELARAIRIAIRTGQPFAAGRIVASFESGNLYLTLPSGRRISYPQARLVEGKFEGAPPDVMFKDNARGNWTDYRGWFGTFIENVVQGTARDLLAAAIERFEARGIPIVLTVHDEGVAEVPAGSITEAEFLAILLEPPAWAVGLPLAGKVWSGAHYLEPPEETPPPPSDGNGRYEEALETESDKLIDELIVEISPHTQPTEGDGAEFLTELDDTVAPLFELVSIPLTDDHKTQCPFHPDDTPSLQFYADHFHCFGCGEHGDRIDWLTRGEGLTREEAIALIQDWDGPALRPRPTEESKTARALELWDQGIPIAGTLAERYLVETRGIDVTKLPGNISDSLRFLARCPFGTGPVRPCLLALMRDAENDRPTGIHRIALELREGRVHKIDRFALGRIGAIKLWPAGAQLVVGEGLETTLAAATRIPYRAAPLQPAWSAVSSGGLSQFPVIPGVERLIVLVDHDGNGEGQAAAERCRERWTRAGRTVVRLTPKRAGADFNDLVMPEPVS